MRSKFESSLVAAIGVQGAAERLLGAKTFDEESEGFFLCHHEELSCRHLLRWLGHSEPDEGPSSRPVAQVVARIVETVHDRRDPLAPPDLPSLVRQVNDDAVRDEIIEALRPKLKPDHWILLAVLASGGEVFTAVRDLERGLIDRQKAPPMALLDAGQLPLLTSKLFGVRRHDAACAAALLSALDDEGTRYYALWLAREAGLLGRIGGPDAVLGRVPPLKEVEASARLRTAFVLDVAREWPDTERGNAWIARRAIDAVSRGIPWGYLWWEIPEDLRDQVAITSLETPKPAPWVARAIARRMTGRAAWDAMFRLMDGPLPSENCNDEFNDGLKSSALALGRPPDRNEIDQAFEAMSPLFRSAWIGEMKLPDDADEGLDARYTKAARSCGVPEHLIVARLLSLPLAPDRARRVARFALDAGIFWRLGRCLEIAEAAGPIDGVSMPSDFTNNTLAAFRALAGDAAGRTLESCFDELLGRGQLDEALALANSAPEVLSEERHAALRQLALVQPISRLADLQESADWLIDRSDVIAQAAREDRDDWGIADRLPERLKPVMLTKIAATDQVRLAESLLDRLEALGASRREILSIALERLRARGPAALSHVWIAARLDTRSLWDEPGTEIVTALLRAHDAEGAALVFSTCLEAATPKGGHQAVKATDLGHTMHTAVGTVLVRIAADALRNADAGLAKRALAGLAHLNPASRLRERVRELRRLTSEDDVISLIETNEALLRRSGSADAATIDAVLYALQMLVSGDSAQEHR
jgi:hypothetical protein